MPQYQQDELYDFYCQFGNHDEKGRVIGLFRARASVTGLERDISWADFKAGRLPAEMRAQEAKEDAAARSHRTRQADAVFGMLLGR